MNATSEPPVCTITTPHSHSSLDDPIACPVRDRATERATYSPTVDDDPDLFLYGTSGYPGPRTQCEVCGMEVIRLNLRQRDGSVRRDFFEVVYEAEHIKDAGFILHSDRHTGRQSRDTR